MNEIILKKVEMIARHEGGEESCIEIILKSGEKIRLWLWENSSKLKTKMFSNNQLREIYEKCMKQVQKMDADDVPPVFTEMLENLRKVMKERNVFIKFDTKPF